MKMKSTPTRSAQLSRRSFLTKGALGGTAAAGAALAAPAVLAQAPIQMRMQTSWPAANIWQQFAQNYADRVEAMSGGRISVDVLPAGAIVGAFQVMDACSDGILDAAHSVPPYWYGKSKASSLFGTGPVYGGDAINLLAWFNEGGGDELYRELTQDILGLNVVGRLGYPMPLQPFGWFKGEVNTVADLQGFRYRTVGLAADLLQKMGMSVAQLPGGEIVPAMERGVIDAFEFNNPTSDRQFGAQDVAKNYYLGSYHQATETIEYIFNKDFLDDLDDDLRAIVMHSVEAATLKNIGFALDSYSADLKALVEEDNVILHQTSDEILDAQLQAWTELEAELMAEDPFMKKVLDSQRAWNERTAYYQIMNDGNASTARAYEHVFPGRLNQG
ncbi:TRAP-type mannitol/chloroaromatic compound transport system substrate-binding protein [Roseinatronobacter thiooxidans]|uniref:TRAP-type mannitol/chloroaromatic compound transport system substrate-binding protein n=1 Tax=Roseinatronobacter thiooxidans TaxID=121821 RepID=A0A2W7PYV6_9RHOB|nr:TRAP-type mannitol/chloroaromatic compound transport system substrate-binding protein [Roseinatronobacter thiooxidans]